MQFLACPSEANRFAPRYVGVDPATGEPTRRTIRLRGETYDLRLDLSVKGFLVYVRRNIGSATAFFALVFRTAVSAAKEAFMPGGLIKMDFDDVTALSNRRQRLRFFATVGKFLAPA